MMKKLPRTPSPSAVLMAFISFVTINVSAQQPQTTIDLFEWTPRWQRSEGDAGTIEFSTTWNTQGSNSRVFHNITASGSNYTAYDADLHYPQNPATIVMDVRNGSAVGYNLKLEVVGINSTLTLLGVHHGHTAGAGLLSIRSFNSYQRENSVDQNYKYNGMEEQDELGLSWLDYGPRMYMPDIGRWGVIDPLSAKKKNENSNDNASADKGSDRGNESGDPEPNLFDYFLVSSPLKKKEQDLPGVPELPNNAVNNNKPPRFENSVTPPGLGR